SVTVATSLIGLFVFRQPLLRSIAVGGITVTLTAAALALVVLPALLGLLDRHLEWGQVPSWERTRSGAANFWRHVAGWVIHRRIVVSLSVPVFLLAWGSPFRRVLPGGADVRALRASEEPRRVMEALPHDLEAATPPADSLLVVMDDDVTRGD